MLFLSHRNACLGRKDGVRGNAAPCWLTRLTGVQGTLLLEGQRVAAVGDVISPKKGAAFEKGAFELVPATPLAVRSKSVRETTGDCISALQVKKRSLTGL